MYVAQPIRMDQPRSGHARPAARLPGEEIHHTYTDYREVARAIREMVIRGAPAIGVAAAMGVALGVLHSPAKIRRGIARGIPTNLRCHRQNPPPQP